MILTSQNILRLTGVTSVLCWFSMLGVNLVALLGWHDTLAAYISAELTWFIWGLFILSVYLFAHIRITQASRANLVDILWNALITGLVAVLASLLLETCGFFWYFA
ncbi:MAG: hypothetical protein HC842_02920, partial [Cytophagales bacterium]|nr:hypothetical protein [Cytophagales bacterium]